MAGDWLNVFTNSASTFDARMPSASVMMIMSLVTLEMTSLICGIFPLARVSTSERWGCFFA